jgi:hypothetical protein
MNDDTALAAVHARLEALERRCERFRRAGVLLLLVQSHVRPDWSALTGGYLRTGIAGEPNPDCKDLRPLYAAIAAGDDLRFRLRANATEKTGTSLKSERLAGDRRNITVVGDDDQAIFKFRGASISNVLGFTAAYPDAVQIVLTRNYRSSQPILDAAYRLIRHNDPDRLEVRNQIVKRLTAVAPAGKAVQHLHFDTLSSEADGVAALIA